MLVERGSANRLPPAREGGPPEAPKHAFSLDFPLVSGLKTAVLAGSGCSHLHRKYKKSSRKYG